MQHDEHVWTWRRWRFNMLGLIVGMIEIGAAGPIHNYFGPGGHYRS